MREKVERELDLLVLEKNMVSERKNCENSELVQSKDMQLMKYKALSENLEEKIAELKILESEMLTEKNSEIQKLSSEYSLVENVSKNLNQKTGRDFL